MIWAVQARAEDAEANEAKAVAAAGAESRPGRKRPTSGKKKAEKEWNRAEGLLYASQLELALGAWREKNARLARHHLEKTQSGTEGVGVRLHSHPV